MSTEHQFKVMIVGLAGSGKTTYLKRLRTGDFDPRYIPTQGCSVLPISFETTEGKVTFNCWDIAGQEHLKGLGSGYYLKADAIIFFGDCTVETGTNLQATLNCQTEAKGAGLDLTKIPHVYVLSKSDVPVRRVNLARHRELTLEFKNNAAHFQISAKSNYNFQKPFLYLAQQLLVDRALQFLPEPPIVPPSIESLHLGSTPIVIRSPMVRSPMVRRSPQARSIPVAQSPTPQSSPRNRTPLVAIRLRELTESVDRNTCCMMRLEEKLDELMGRTDLSEY